MVDLDSIGPLANCFTICMLLYSQDKDSRMLLARNLSGWSQFRVHKVIEGSRLLDSR